MNESREFELLSDVAKLLNKYGSDTFERLADRLSNPELRERIIQILSTTKQLSPDKKGLPRRTQSTNSKVDFRSELLAFELDKSNLLMRLYDGLASKELLPTMRAVQIFAQDNGFPPVKAKSRDKAINSFVKVFFSMPYQEIEMHLRNMNAPIDLSDRSLEGWSNIIFGESKKPH